jgi:hypothetical protein
MHPTYFLNVDELLSGPVQTREPDGDNGSSADNGRSQESQEESSDLSDHLMKRKVKITTKARYVHCLIYSTGVVRLTNYSKEYGYWERGWKA